MKKIGEIMAEMGFRKEAPDSVKEAFIKHLIRSSTGAIVETPSELKERQNNPGPAHPEVKSEPRQLSFDFSQDKEKNIQKVS